MAVSEHVTNISGFNKIGETGAPLNVFGVVCPNASRKQVLYPGGTIFHLIGQAFPPRFGFARGKTCPRQILENRKVLTVPRQERRQDFTHNTTCIVTTAFVK
jgi:hypothetical protein